MATDTTELGLERLICAGLAGHPCDPPAEGTVADPPAGYGGVGWSGGSFHDYDRVGARSLVGGNAAIWSGENPALRG